MSLLLGLLLGAGLFLIWQSGYPSPRTNKAPALGGVRRRLDQAGFRGISVGAYLGFTAGLAALAAVIVYALTSAWTLALAFAGIAAVLPGWWIGMQAVRRTKALRGVWPEVVDHLRSAVRAGLPMTEALAQLGRQGPVEVREAFSAYAADLRVAQRADDALETLNQRLADPVAERIVAAIRLTREVGGGDVGETLSTLAGFLRTDAQTRGELEARQSWTVNGARLAVAAPWVILLVMSLEPRVATAYSTPAGAVVILAGAVIAVVSYRAMMRIARLPEEERLYT